jgi:signal transduction histidine kinase
MNLDIGKLMDFVLKWAQHNLDIVYFIYGMAFMVMGIAILVQPKKGSKYKLGAILWLLAGFGLVHGLNEFLDMWAVIKGDSVAFEILRSVILIFSYLFLFEFGRRLFCISRLNNRTFANRVFFPWWLTPLFGFVVLILVVSSPNNFWEAQRTWPRYILGFPGAIVTSIGFMLFYKSNKRNFAPFKARKYFYLASACFLVYGILGGLVVSRGSILLSNVINTDSFFYVVHIPVQVFRAACALSIAYAVYGIIQIFYWENVEVLRRTSDDLRLEYEAGKEKIREIEKLLAVKMQFVSMVSHELKTPLAATKANIDLTLSGRCGRLNADQKMFLGIAGDNVDRLSRLIADILGFQTLTSGMVKYEFAESDINEAITAAEDIMLPLVKEKGLYLTLKLAKDLPVVKIDRDKIIEVLDNLIINAVKSAEKGGIIVCSERADNFIEVSVEDSGCGIKDDDLSKIFEPFVHVKKKEGTGLGLAICREIINAHKGKIWAESQFGKGSKFHFVLPVEGGG